MTDPQLIAALPAEPLPLSPDQGGGYRPVRRLRPHAHLDRRYGMSLSMKVPPPEFGDPCGPWRRAFAWLPTRMFDGHRVWLRRYWRRSIQKHSYLDGGPDFWWQNSDFRDD